MATFLMHHGWVKWQDDGQLSWLLYVSLMLIGEKVVLETEVALNHKHHIWFRGIYL